MLERNWITDFLALVNQLNSGGGASNYLRFGGAPLCSLHLLLPTWWSIYTIHTFSPSFHQHAACASSRFCRNFQLSWHGRPLNTWAKPVQKQPRRHSLGAWINLVLLWEVILQSMANCTNTHISLNLYYSQSATMSKLQMLIPPFGTGSERSSTTRLGSTCHWSQHVPQNYVRFNMFPV